MIIMCGSRDDKHAAFPHRLVIPGIKAIPPDKTLNQVLSEAKHVYVICTACDHWVCRITSGEIAVYRERGSCTCRVDCHYN